MPLPTKYCCVHCSKAPIVQILFIFGFFHQFGPAGFSQGLDKVIGQVLPLATVLGKLAHEAPGQVLKVEFEREDGRFIYEIRLLQNDGRMAKLKVDAVDGRVLSIKRREAGKDTDAHPRGGR